MTAEMPKIVTHLTGDVSGLARAVGEGEALVDKYGENVEKKTRVHGERAGEAGGKGLTEKLEEEIGKPTVADRPLAGIAKKVQEKFQEIGAKSGKDFTTGIENEVKRLETTLTSLADEMVSSGKFDLMKQFKETGRDLGIAKKAQEEFARVKAEAEKLGSTIADALAPKSGGGGNKQGGMIDFALDEFVVNGAKKIAQMVQTGIPDGLNALSGAGTGGLTQYLVVGIAAAAPAIGAALNAAVLLGIGGGGIAVGLAAAAQDPKVKDAWSGAIKGIFSEFKDASKPLIDPMIEGAAKVQAAFGRAGPAIQDSMRLAAPVVDQLVSGVAALVDNAGPGFAAAFEASLPIMAMVGNELLPKMGDALNQFFLSMAAGGPGATIFFHDLINVLDLTIVGLGQMIEWLSKAYEWGSKLGLTGGPILDWMSKLIPAGESGKQGLEAVGQGGDAAAAGVERANKALSDFINEAFRMQDSQLALQKGLFDIGHAFDKNGQSLDINTEKGLANREAMQHQVETIARWRQEQLDAHKAPTEVNAAVDRQIQLMYDGAKAHGANRAQLDELVNSWRAILSLPSAKTMVTYHNDIYGVSYTSSSPSTFYHGMAKGGIVQHAATGLITQPGIYAGQGEGSVVMAEQETKKEGYFPQNISGPNAYGLLSEMASWKGWSIDTGNGGPGPSGGGGGSGPSGGGGGSSPTIVVQLQVDSRTFYEQVVLPQQYQWLQNNGYVPGQTASGR